RCRSGARRGGGAARTGAVNHGRGFRRRNRLSHHPGCLLQDDRPAHFSHGAVTSSLRAQGLGRAEGDRAFLDHHRDSGADRFSQLEDSLMAAIAEVRSRDATRRSRVARRKQPVGDTAAKRSLIVGLGATGVAVARYLCARGESVRVIDSRAAPPGLAELKAACPEADVVVETLDPRWLDDASRVLLSPGLAYDIPLALEARRRGLAVIGDVELFALAARAPVIAVTGSNGKSTVTTLASEMLKA